MTYYKAKTREMQNKFIFPGTYYDSNKKPKKGCQNRHPSFLYMGW
jgi:hypothetical protein